MIISGLGAPESRIMGQAVLSLNNQDRTATAPAVAAPVLPDPSLSSSLSVPPSANMLSGLFVSQAGQQSEYIAATLKGLDLGEQMRTAMNADSFTLVDAMGGLFWEKPPADEDTKYTDAVKDKFKADRLAEQDMEKKTVEASKPGLEQTREDIEEAAEPEGQDQETQGAKEAQEADKDSGQAVADDSTATAVAEGILAQGAEEETIVQAVERVQEEKAASRSIPEVDPATGLAYPVQAAQTQTAQAVGSTLDLLV